MRLWLKLVAILVVQKIRVPRVAMLFLTINRRCHSVLDLIGYIHSVSHVVADKVLHWHTEQSGETKDESERLCGDPEWVGVGTGP